LLLIRLAYEPASACARQLYLRFYEAFAPHGEPNIPVDRLLLQSPQFFLLLQRLRLHANEHQRDHW